MKVYSWWRFLLVLQLWTSSQILGEDVKDCSECSHSCLRTYAGPICSCPPGFHLAADKRTCTDKDECGEENGGCMLECENHHGEHECACNVSCRPGYKQMYEPNCVKIMYDEAKTSITTTTNAPTTTEAPTTTTAAAPDVTVTWYKQERTIDSYIKQDNLPKLSALTLCFRFKPLILHNKDKRGGTYIISIFTGRKTKKWNLGIRTNPSLAFGISPNSYFTDGADNFIENELWKEEHKHCFVWEKKPGPFKWYVDAETPGHLKLFRTVTSNRVSGIRAGGAFRALQEQDTLGGGLDIDQMTPGWIAQLNLYDYAMAEEDVISMNMFCKEKGNVINDETFEVIGHMERATADLKCLS